MLLNEKDVDKLEGHLWHLTKTSTSLPRYDEVSMPLFGIGGYHPDFWAALGRVTERTMITHGVALSAIVVNQDGVPGNDFYPLLGLKKPSSSKDLPVKHMVAWTEQLTKIYGMKK